LNDEQILDHRTDARWYAGEKPKYKDLTYFGDQQLGNFILTDRRILFLRKTTVARTLGGGALELIGGVGLFAGMPATLLIGDMAGGRVASSKIKVEEVEKILADDPQSIAIPLEGVVEANAKRAYMTTAYLMVKQNTVQGIKGHSFVFGTAAKKQNELADKIMKTKQNLGSRPATAVAPRAVTPRAVAPTTAAATKELKFCINCGKKIPSAASFCPKCGGKQ